MGSPASENLVKISSTVSKIFPDDKQSDISILFICDCIHSIYVCTYVCIYSEYAHGKKYQY